MLKKLIATGVLLGFVVNATAVEPHKDRARLYSLNAELLLPDETLLNVDMSFDCGSNYADTAMIITSKAGAEILSAAYTALWGEKYGQMVMDQWNNKTNPDDPRKPTFIIVTMPSEHSVNSGKRKVDKFAETLSKQAFAGAPSATGDPSFVMPQLISACGTLQHDPDGNP